MCSHATIFINYLKKLKHQKNMHLILATGANLEVARKFNEKHKLFKLKQKENENQSLTQELNSLKQQLEGIQIQIQDREKKLSLIKRFSKKIHIDILDGDFSSETSFIDPSFFKKYENDFFMEVHLMVNDPASYVKPFAQNGFKRFLGHIEKMKNLDEFVAEGQIFGEIGLALDLETPVETISINFDDIDSVLLMGVKAGKSGQKFMPEILNKIK